jgi:MoxR-like ATPase
VLENVSKVIVGKNDIITLVFISFVCSGHVLLEDVPGTGKTMLLRAFAKTVGGNFKRIQFTPDLLPSDLTGIHFYNQKTGEFQFRPGPLFSHMVLGDEINRATPRTQSSLLEAMAERQITVDGDTKVLEEPFMVMATQNPIESYGTFPLPEAQLDRFFMRLSLGYMTRAEEKQVMARRSTVDLAEGLAPVLTLEDIAFLKNEYSHVIVSDDVSDYIMTLAEGTRNESRFIAGVSTRGVMALYRAAQVWAAIDGRDYVIPEDVRYLAIPVLAHRISAGRGADAGESQRFLAEIIEKTPVPLETVNPSRE